MAMGLQALLTMTGFYVVKYVLYIAMVIGAVLLGKKWADKSDKTKKVNVEE